MLGDKARVLDVRLSTKVLKIGLPAFAVRRIGKHEIKFLGRKGVGGQGGAVLHVIGLGSFAFEQQIRLANGIGFRVDFLPEKMDRYVLAALIGQIG